MKQVDSAVGKPGLSRRAHNPQSGRSNRPRATTSLNIGYFIPAESSILFANL